LKLVLDTNIYCDFAEDVPTVVDILAEFGDELFLPTIVIAELTYGFMKGTRQSLPSERSCRRWCSAPRSVFSLAG